MIGFWLSLPPVIIAALIGLTWAFKNYFKPASTVRKIVQPGWVYFLSAKDGAFSDPPAPIKIGMTHRDPAEVVGSACSVLRLVRPMFSDQVDLREIARLLLHTFDLMIERQNTYRAKFQTFLNNTSQAGGEIILSLPLDGEGRTLSAGKRQNSTTVTFPARSSDAVEALYVVAHELIGQLVQTAVTDNVTPTDTRAGLTDRYVAAGTVRGGLMLLQKIAPGLTDGYARYYLRSANRPAGSNAESSLAAAFPLPNAIRDAISRQLDVVLGGI